MYFHREAMRKFKWKHPYLLTMLETFVVITMVALCSILGFGPILVAVFLHWSGIFAYLITIPLAVTAVKYVSDLFIF